MPNGVATERKILLTSFVAGFVFAITEFIVGIISGSQSVLTDGAYDATELLIIGATLFLTPLFHKPATEKHPFGFLQLESIFVIFKGFAMTGVTLTLVSNSILIMLGGGSEIDSMAISIFQLVVGSLCLVVYMFMKKMTKKHPSPTIAAELYGWRLDVFYSLGMSIAFFVSSFLDNTFLAPISPYFDQIVAILIVLTVLPDLFKMIKSAIRDVFLFAPEKEIFDRIKEISCGLLGEYEYKTNFVDVTRTGRKLWISIYYIPCETTVKVETVSEINERLNKLLVKEFGSCEAELVLDA